MGRRRLDFRTCCLKETRLRMKCLLTIWLFLLVSSGHIMASNEMVKVVNPVEISSEVVGHSEMTKDIEGLQWNRWTSKNFVVCSINDTQAQYLYKHLELVKGWVFARWGLYDIDFETECKFICVDDSVLFNKLFKLERTKVEIRRNKDGKIKEMVIFILLDNLPSRCIPMPLTEVCMAEFAQKYETKFSTWCVRGMSMLNCTIPQIKRFSANLKKSIDADELLYFSEALLTTDRDQYLKLNLEKRQVFDNCAMMFCLMVRKEFGQDAYLNLMKQSSEADPVESIKSVLKFESYKQLDKSFHKYINDLTLDMSLNKTPDKYLQITENVAN